MSEMEWALAIVAVAEGDARERESGHAGAREQAAHALPVDDGGGGVGPDHRHVATAIDGPLAGERRTVGARSEMDLQGCCRVAGNPKHSEPHVA